MNPLLDLSRRLTVLPVVHGSADFALQVTRFLTEHPYDCLAVPLPPSFAAPVEDGVELLPRVSVESDRRKAIREAIGLAGPGDIVLLAGKGHENYQEIGRERFPFDDSEIAAEVLGALR